MGPKRILFIRHAEKPATGFGKGVDAAGNPDDDSLAVRGWQRAGALAHFFSSEQDARWGRVRPDAVYAPGLGPGSKSKRPMQTIEPLVALLQETSRVKYVNSYLKDDGAALMADVLAQEGVVLVSWEHKVLTTLFSHVPAAPAVPAIWPEDRYDMTWMLERGAQGWAFSQYPQMLLAGDSSKLIE
ncbi:phosphoglycerate mutase family protein [Paraburkholderia acidisoli]|uniref:Phosphoglycerate mutase family protein n=1 Tax=Paraburkholderia acidisoli TaxID=2571748 RepID=A0A7Z2GLE9_9BURK|nr:phosphoglycerate mutase family protein [Paraburkholderia acidisoli]QGZ63589.1 phosphoglycerate mutase family protein [Paraburkholderia acidisoli]